MTLAVNPYDHLPTKHLERQLRIVSKKLTKISLRGDPKGNFEYLRAIFLSISQSLERRAEIAIMEEAAALTEESVPELG